MASVPGLIVWSKGDRFNSAGKHGWTVMDFDLLSGTVLGIHSDGSTEAFYFHEVERVTH